MARIIGEVRPRYVFVENSPLLVSRGLGTVLTDLAAMGFSARWGIVGADDCGAPHRRKRIWIVAHAVHSGKRGRTGSVAETTGEKESGESKFRGSAFDTFNSSQDAADAESQRGWTGLGEERQEQHGGELADGGCEMADTCGGGVQGKYEADRLPEGWSPIQLGRGCQTWWAIDPADQPGAVESGLG